MIAVICTSWGCYFIVAGTTTGAVALSMSYRCDMLGILLSKVIASRNQFEFQFFYFE
ncbi:hypothetical protein D083_1770 [Dickeya solani RNS 08.23.3.1.A]|nr:hypothetical protein D083_1770 [Dickeya solani RNS 08.23.3.1.A]